MFFRLAFVATLVLCGTVRTSDAQWVSEPAAGWVSFDFYHHDTRQRYDQDGKEVDFADQGHAVTSSFFLTASAGVVRGVDAWAQVPYVFSQFDDLAGDRNSSGFADPRFYLRVSPAVFGLETPFPVALRAGVKLQGAQFSVDSETVPISDGQRDWELMLELGYSAHPVPIYVAGWAGHRWRERNTDIDRKPGNEWFGFLKVGGSEGRVVWMVDVEGLRGDPPESFGLLLETARRELVQITPRLGIETPLGTFLAGVRMPLIGRNYPSGPAFVTGFFRTFSLGSILGSP